MWDRISKPKLNENSGKLPRHRSLVPCLIPYSVGNYCFSSSPHHRTLLASQHSHSLHRLSEALKAMSTRRPSGSIMGPPLPPDRDVIMGPPPIPIQQHGALQSPKDVQEVTEKYKKLKRRYFELEEVRCSHIPLTAYRTYILTWRLETQGYVWRITSFRRT